jgi:hypothetical protein
LVADFLDPDHLSLEELQARMWLWIAKTQRLMISDASGALVAGLAGEFSPIRSLNFPDPDHQFS